MPGNFDTDIDQVVQENNTNMDDAQPRPTRRQERRLTGGIATGMEQIRLPSHGTLLDDDDDSDEDDFLHDVFPLSPAGHRSIWDPWNATSLMPPDRRLQLQRRRTIASMNDITNSVSQRVTIDRTPSLFLGTLKEIDENSDSRTVTTTSEMSMDKSLPVHDDASTVLCEGLVWTRKRNAIFTNAKLSRRYFVLESNGSLTIYKIPKSVHGNVTANYYKVPELVEKTRIVKKISASSVNMGDQYKGLVFQDKDGHEKLFFVRSKTTRKKWLQSNERLSGPL